MKIKALSFALCLFSGIAGATEIDATRESLNMIADFAEKMCHSAPIESTSENVQLNGQAKAELDGLIKKLVNLGVDGSAKYESNKYSGVLQQDLAKLISESKDCRLAIWNDMKGKFGMAQKQCRLQANGIEYYSNQERWGADSGWRSGGSSPAQYCGSKLIERQVVYQDRKIELLASGEDHRSIYDPFKRDEYRYTCSFQDSWGPVFRLASSSQCN